MGCSVESDFSRLKQMLGKALSDKMLEVITAICKKIQQNGNLIRFYSPMIDKSG
jgi:hypothetical protein